MLMLLLPAKLQRRRTEISVWMCLPSMIAGDVECASQAKFLPFGTEHIADLGRAEIKLLGQYHIISTPRFCSILYIECRFMFRVILASHQAASSAEQTRRGAQAIQRSKLNYKAWSSENERSSFQHRLAPLALCLSLPIAVSLLSVVLSVINILWKINFKPLFRCHSCSFPMCPMSMCKQVPSWNKTSSVFGYTHPPTTVNTPFRPGYSLLRKGMQGACQDCAITLGQDQNSKSNPQL